MFVYVDVAYYSTVEVIIRTNRNITASNPPGIGSTWINTSPSGTNVTFTADSIVYPTSNQTGIAVPIMYDSNDLNYYINPAGDSNAYRLTLYSGTATGATSFDGNSLLRIDSSGNQYIEFRTAAASSGT